MKTGILYKMIPKQEKEKTLGELVAERQARDAVDTFLSILEPWFHPDDKWQRIESLANEFLYEDLVSRFKKIL